MSLGVKAVCFYNVNPECYLGLSKNQLTAMVHAIVLVATSASVLVTCTEMCRLFCSDWCINMTASVTLLYIECTSVHWYIYEMNACINARTLHTAYMHYSACRVHVVCAFVLMCISVTKCRYTREYANTCAYKHIYQCNVFSMFCQVEIKC